MQTCHYKYPATSARDRQSIRNSYTSFVNRLPTSAHLHEMVVEDSSLLVAAIFTFLLTLSLLGFFIYLIISIRADRTGSIARMSRLNRKIMPMQTSLDRTFREFMLLIDRKFTFMYQWAKVRKGTMSTQTEHDEVGLESFNEFNRT